MSLYFEKYGFKEYAVPSSVRPDTFLIVVIPCYNEPALLSTMQSLYDCRETNGLTEVIIVINSSENDTEEALRQNKKTYNDAVAFAEENHSGKLRFYILDAKNLPAKHAGVGLARKIGMDCAALRFNAIEKPEGVIVCLDADCTVAGNYLVELEDHFRNSIKTTGCSIHFEHPLHGDLSPQHYKAITNYELFLRYYRLALYHTGFPYSFHTIGSAMAVRNYVYQKQGGMNRRKAGEDFYFLHKVFPLGNFSELNTTCVYPSARESLRVPFGTGSAVTKMLRDKRENNTDDHLSYHFQSFMDLKMFFDSAPSFYQLNEVGTPGLLNSMPESVQSFLKEHHPVEKITELRGNAASSKQFINRFYRWFDGFMVLKFVHHARDHFYSNEKIDTSCYRLLTETGNSIDQKTNNRELLEFMRKLDTQKSIATA